MVNLFRTFSNSKKIFRTHFPTLIHTSVQLKHIISHDDDFNTSILDSLHEGLNWKTLTQRFKSVGFTNPLVQTILLQLKEPSNSRKALNLFHWSAKEMHVQHGTSTFCMTIHILVKGRLIKDSKALLETVLSKPSSHDKTQVLTVLDSLLNTYEAVDSIAFVFDLFIRTCAKLRMVDVILDACKLLFDHGFRLNLTTFNILLHVMQKSDKTDLLWGVYRHMIETRVCPDEVTTQIMVKALCKEGKLEKFLDILDRMCGKRCSVSAQIVNTCLVYEMIEEDWIEDGLLSLKRMLQKDMIVDTVSFSLVVFAKVKMGNLCAAMEIYKEMLKRGFHENAFICSLFTGAYCEEGRIDDAVALLEKMETLGFKPPAETFSLMIKGCSINGRLDDSLVFCKKMVRIGHIPSCSAVSEMIGKLCENWKTEQADEMLTILLDKGLSCDENAFSHLIYGYCKDGNIERAITILFEMEFRSLSPNMLGFTSLIVGLCKCERLIEANKYLEMMKSRSLLPSPNVYKELIASHWRKGDKTRAHQLNCEMVGTWPKTDDSLCMEFLVDLPLMQKRWHG
ncbi:uncharacterized protein LOC142504603 isoform X2 [Primulina tabacum]